MSDDKKPKKDLRARLGRTIAPNTPGAPAIAPPSVGAPAAAPPSAAPAAAAAVAAPPIAAPAIAAPAIAAPPIAAPAVAKPKLPFGGPDVAPPPFAQPAKPTPSEPPKARPPADPFASGPSSAGPSEMRLVIDDRTAVDDAEVGRQQRGRTFLVVGICLVVGVGLGAGLASMNGSRQIYNTAVRDGDSLYEAVNTASTSMTQVQTHLDAIIASAAGSATAPPSVNREEITALRSIANPMEHMTPFETMNYRQFPATTVHDLHAYHANIQRIWASIQALAGRALPDGRQAEMARTAPTSPVSLDDGAEMMTAIGGSTLFGVVLQSTEQGIVGQLAYIEPIPDDATHFNVRATRGGQPHSFAVFNAEAEVGSSPEFVVPVDGAGSVGVLRDQTGAFGQYVTDLRALKQLVDETIEIQGRLTTALGDVARLEEVFTIGG